MGVAVGVDCEGDGVGVGCEGVGVGVAVGVDCEGDGVGVGDGCVTWARSGTGAPRGANCNRSKLTKSPR